MFGTRVLRFVALSVLCLAVASATAQAQVTPLTKFIGGVSGVKIITTFTTAKFTVATNVATALTIGTGTDKTYLVTTPDRMKIKHVVTVQGLSPNTSYYVLITATAKNGKLIKAWKSFKTLAPGAAPATVTSNGSKLLLNGKPFFPVLATGLACPDQSTISTDALLGVNVFDDSAMQGCLQNQDTAQTVSGLESMFSDKIWLKDQSSADAQLLQGLPQLIGWQTNTTFPSAYDYLGSCGDYTPPAGTTSAGGIFTSTQAASRISPTGYYVDLTNQVRPSVGFCLSGVQLKAIFWTVVAGNGASIEYNTQLPWNATGGVSVNSDVQTAAGVAITHFKTLGPVILTGKSTQATSMSSSSVKTRAWQYDGSVYVLAVNTDSKATQIQLSVPNLSGPSTAIVMWEDRNVVINHGTISDNFPPLAVHIYKISQISPAKK